jgi:hypothetical protein
LPPRIWLRRSGIAGAGFHGVFNDFEFNDKDAAMEAHGTVEVTGTTGSVPETPMPFASG